MADDCLVRLLDPENKKALFGNVEVPDDVIRRVVQDIETIKKNVLAGGDTSKLNSRLSEYIAEKQQLSEIEVQIKANNLKKVKTRMGFIMQQAWKGDYAEAFKSLMDKATTLANGGQNSVTARSAARFDDWTNYLNGSIIKSGAEKQFLSGQIDKELFGAVHALAMGDKMPAGTTKEIEEIAKALHTINKSFFADMRAAGVPVRDMPGYITRQTHDIDKVRAMGAEAWAAEVRPFLDPVKTFGIDAGNAEKELKFLMRVHKEISAGIYGLDGAVTDKDISDQFMQIGHTQSLTNKLSERRTLIFNGPDSAFNYNAKYGTGNLAQTFVKEMQRNAKAISLIETFGDKPEAAIRADIERVKRTLAMNKQDKELAAFKAQEKRIIDMFNSLTSTDTSAGDNTIAKIGSNIRAFQVVSKLGTTGLRSLNNLAGGAVELKNSSGQNFLQSIMGFTKETVMSIPESRRKVFASGFMELVNDMNHATINALGVADVGMGQRLAQTMTKYNGLDILNNSYKHAISIERQKSWAQGGDFRALPERMQGSLLESGIDKHDWEMFKLSTEVAEDGRVLVTPEAVKLLTEESTLSTRTAKAKEYGLKKPESHESYIRDLELKMRSNIIQSGNLASTTAGLREMSALTAGTQTGTGVGETARLLTQFKSFVLQSMNIGKRFLNGNPNSAMLEKGILMSEGKDVKSIAQWVVASTALAYMADTAIRFSLGKEQKDPTSPSTWIDAVGQSGTGGMWADFAAGPWEKYSYVENLAGPTFGQLNDVAEVFARTKEAALAGKNPMTKATMAGASKLIRNNTPFQNFPGVKQGLDYIQWDVIQTALTPDFRQKQELKKLREQGRR